MLSRGVVLQRLKELIPIKAGEGFITAVMFLYIFGVLFFYYILDPIRKGLFLEGFPAAELPYAYFLTAACAGIVATVTFRLSRRWSAIALMTAINVAIIGTLIYFRWAMGTSSANRLSGEAEIWYLPWLYYVYVKTVSVLSTAQFWLLAGYMYDSRQAKRIYSLLGVGAILGAIGGSAVAAAKGVQPEAMLAFCMAVCACLIVLSWIAWRYRRTGDSSDKTRIPAEETESLVDLWRVVFRSPHLRWMAALIFFALIASQMADWQLDYSMQQEFGRNRNLIKEFVGRFNLITNILALLMQLFLTRFLITRLGILPSILFLPLCLFLSSGALLLWPTLFTAALARGSDTVSRYSLNRAAVETLYLPLSPSLRARLKLFVDVFVDRAGRAVAGIVILVLTSSLHVGATDVRRTAAVAIGLTFICMIACVKLSGTYLSAFREHLKRREVELEDVAHYVSDRASVQLLVNTLEGSNDRQILYALRLLQSVRGVDFSPQVLPLLNHPLSHVREEALRTLQSLPIHYIAEAERLSTDSSPEVRAAAVGYLCSHEDGSHARLNSFLESGSADIRIAAARWAAGNAPADFEPTLEQVESLIAIRGVHAVEARTAAANLSARVSRPESQKVLSRLIEDEDSAVVAAAAQAAGSAGHLKLVLNIANILAVPDRRSAARAGLLRYGERIVGTLGDLIADSGTDLHLRRELPWVLGRIPVQSSVDILSAELGSEDSVVRYRVLKSLNRLHETNASLQLPHEVIEEHVRDELRYYYRLLSMKQAIDRAPNPPGTSIVSTALAECLARQLEVVFRLLGLEHPRKEIYFAYLALTGSRERRIAAVEFLDNVLSRSIKPMVLPLLESTPEALVERAKQSFGIETSSREEALETLRSSPDAWLRRCATYETGERSESMNTIERVILLQGVELFAGATTEQLSFIAAISRETRATTGTILYRQGDEPNGLYVVISGRVAVTRGADVIETIGPNGSFGVWALFDDQPRLTDAAAVEDSNVLFVPREDFYDVLSDHVEITQSVFKHLVQRVRRLASVGERDGA